MKHTSLTLLSLAALAPAAFALDVKDDDMKVGLSLYFQGRAEMTYAQSNTQATPDYSPAEGANLRADTVDFSVRRARIGFKGTYQGVYKFGVIVRADGAGRKSDGDKAPVELYTAFIEREWKMPNDIHLSLGLGLDNASFNTSGNVLSSSTFQTLNESPTAALASPRAPGIKLKVKAPWVSAFVDVQNNSKLSKTPIINDLDGSAVATPDGDSAGAVGFGNADAQHNEGLWYSARFQFTPEGEWKMEKPMESFAGVPGKGFMFSFEMGKNLNDNVGTPADAVAPDATHNYSAAVAGTTINATAYGVDAILHMDGLSALVEYRILKQEWSKQSKLTSPTITSGSQMSAAWRIQAGYAFQMGSVIIEPAFRYSMLDLSRDCTVESGSFGADDYGASGKQWELGVNCYLNGHANQIGLAYLNWKAESEKALATGLPDSTGQQPTASIVRAQWQLTF